MNFAEPLRYKFDYKGTIKMFMAITSTLVVTMGWWFKPTNVLASLILILIVVIAKTTTDWQMGDMKTTKGLGLLKTVKKNIYEVKNYK